MSADLVIYHEEFGKNAKGQSTTLLTQLCFQKIGWELDEAIHAQLDKAEEEYSEIGEVYYSSLADETELDGSLLLHILKQVDLSQAFSKDELNELFSQIEDSNEVYEIEFSR